MQKKRNAYRHYSIYTLRKALGFVTIPTPYYKYELNKEVICSKGLCSKYFRRRSKQAVSKA